MEWASRIELPYQALKYKQKLDKKRGGKETSKEGRIGKHQDEQENSPCTQPASIFLIRFSHGVFTKPLYPPWFWILDRLAFRGVGGSVAREVYF